MGAEEEVTLSLESITGMKAGCREAGLPKYCRQRLPRVLPKHLVHTEDGKMGRVLFGVTLLLIKDN